MAQALLIMPSASSSTDVVAMLNLVNVN